MIPDQLKHGDAVRVIAPSRSMAILSERTKAIANQRFDDLRLNVVLVPILWIVIGFIQARLDDLHDAFRDKNVQAIFTAIGDTYNNDSSLHVMQKLGFVFEEDFLYGGIIHKLHRLTFHE